MDKFSKEYLFMQCNIKKHCICINFINPICIEDNIIPHIYLINVCLTEIEEKQMLSNISNKIDTYGELNISFFLGLTNPLALLEGTINTANIESVELLER